MVQDKIHDDYTTAHKGAARKLGDEPKSSKSTEFQAGHLAIYSCGRWPKIRIHLGSGSWHDSVGLEPDEK